MIKWKGWAVQEFGSSKDRIVGYKNTDKEKTNKPCC